MLTGKAFSSAAVAVAFMISSSSIGHAAEAVDAVKDAKAVEETGKTVTPVKPPADGDRGRSAGAAVKEKYRIAILDFKANGVPETTAKTVTIMIQTEFINKGLFIVLERERIDAIFKERSLTKGQCSDNECAVQLGRVLSAKKILIGEVSRLGDSTLITARIVDAEEGVSESAEYGKADKEADLGRVVQDIVNSFSNRIIPLRPPYDLKATEGKFKDRVRLTWTRTPDADRYFIYRARRDKGDFSQIANTMGTAFEDTGVEPGTKYLYKVKGWGYNGYTEFTAEIAGHAKGVGENHDYRFRVDGKEKQGADTLGRLNMMISLSAGGGYTFNQDLSSLMKDDIHWYADVLSEAFGFFPTFYVDSIEEKPWQSYSLDLDTKVFMNRYGAGLSVGYFSGYEMKYTIKTDDNSTTITGDVNFTMTPVLLTLYYRYALSASSFVALGAGGGYYMGKIAYQEKASGFISGSGAEDFKGDTFGIHAKIEYNYLFGNIGMFAGLLGRYGEIDSFKSGDYTMVAKGSEEVKVNITGVLLYFGAGVYL